MWKIAVQGRQRAAGASADRARVVLGTFLRNEFRAPDWLRNADFSPQRGKAATEALRSKSKSTIKSKRFFAACDQFGI